MIERNYPVVNDWRKGCSVWRPQPKADRDYVYQREFVRGQADKTNGVLRYSLAELGGPGWAVAKDRYGTRTLLELRELSYIDHGELPAVDVLAIVRNGSWDGTKCPDHLRALLDGPCADCEEQTETRERVAAYAATAPDLEPF